MRFSQIAIVVLVVMGMITQTIPVWLGLAALGAWAAAKVLMRGLLAQIERKELATHRLGGAALELHKVEPLSEGDPGRATYRVEFSVVQPDQVEWQPRELVVFPSDGPIKPCTVERCEVWDEGKFQPCGPELYLGTARVRLRIDAPARASGLVISYHGERVGVVSLRG